MVADIGVGAEPEQAPGQADAALLRRDVQRGLPRVLFWRVRPALCVDVEAEPGEQLD